MRTAPALAVLLAGAVALLGSAAATAAVGAPTARVAPAPQASLGELEEEVMCPVCGTLLGLAESPQALREKAFLSRLIAQGRTKEQIKDALVAEYGTEVLALPQGSGFDLSAYLVPIIALLAAATGLALAVLRWRRRSVPPGQAPPAAPSGADAARLEADIERYDL